MLEANAAIKGNVFDLLGPYFEEKAIREAVQFLQNGQVTLSFSKGNADTYFVASGIIEAPHLYEARVTFKSQAEDSKKVQSLCSCRKWRSDLPCSHVASLFLKFLLQGPSKVQTERLIAVTTAQANNLPVTPPSYGHIIEGPHKFHNAQGRTSYSALSYKLVSGNIIAFPLPLDFRGKMKIEMKRIQGAFTDRPNAELDVENYEFLFKYITPQGEEVEEISILDSIYLFDWRHGVCLHLGGAFKDFVRKVRSSENVLTLEEALRITLPLRESNDLQLFYQDSNWNDLPEIKPEIKFSLSQSKKNNFLHVTLELLDQEGRVLPIPQSLLLFIFDNGHLSSFKKKADAISMVKALILYLSEIEGPSEEKDFRKFLRSSDDRETLEDWINFFEKSSSIQSFHPEGKSKFSLDCSVLKSLLFGLLDSFTETFFRFSNYSREERTLSFEVPTPQILGRIADFYEKVRPLGVLIYYNRNEIKTWSTRIRFERRSTGLNWFDLELKINMEDLKLMEAADVENRYIVSDKGLVLLTADQREILKFIKKFTKKAQKQEEAKAKQDPDSPESVQLEQSQNFVLSLNKARIFELFELKRLGIEGALTAEEEALCHRLLSFKEMPEYPLPPNFAEIARPYQVQGFNWLSFLHENKLGACLADDMGLGKTLQTIMFIQSIYHKVERVLIVCPVSILINWENEFKKFSDLDIKIYYGGDRSYPDGAKIVITSYGVMKREADGVLKDKKFDVFVMDEVHHLKNLRTLGAFSARLINADFRIALTGTPVENDLSEFFNIIDLCLPGIWGDLQFLRLVSNKTSRSLAKKTARPFILRRTKAQVLTELPNKTEHHVFLNFAPEEAAAYEKSLLTIRDKIKDAIPRKKYGEILKGLLELRQLCLWQHQGQISTKIQYLLENLEQIIEEGHQVLIFSQFTTYLDIIEKSIHEKHWRFSRIDGTQTHKKRQGHIDEFQSGKNSIFLISLKAGGVGLNLTAASYIFLMDPWWNPAVEAQAIDRAHRIGQKNKLTVFRPIIKGSVEEKVLKLQESKKELFHDLLSDEDENFFSGKLTINDFEGLLF